MSSTATVHVDIWTDISTPNQYVPFSSPVSMTNTLQQTTPINTVITLGPTTGLSVPFTAGQNLIAVFYLTTVSEISGSQGVNGTVNAGLAIQ